MDEELDPNKNHVTFHLKVDGKPREFTGVGPTRAVDCVSAVWQQLQRTAKLKAADVSQIYSEWEPAEEDLKFLDETFPAEAELAFTFARPAARDWDRALSAAAKVIAQSDTKARR